MNKQRLAVMVMKEQGLLPLFYHDDPQICIVVAKALYNAGVRCIEFTNRGEKALENFKVLVNEREHSMPGLILGVGTVKSPYDAVSFIENGADFLVSPIFDKGVCDVAKKHNILWVPGCMTPTEIHVAQQAGCSLIKLFPGNLLAPAFVEAIQPLFNGLNYMVTGGVEVSEASIEGWFKTGVSCIGLGSKLITKDILLKGDYATLTSKTKEVLAIILKLKKV